MMKHHSDREQTSVRTKIYLMQISHYHKAAIVCLFGIGTLMYVTKEA